MATLMSVRPNSLSPVVEPFRLMRDFLRWDPYREAGLEYGEASNTFLPSFDVKETSEAYVFKADMPGIRQEDLDIDLTGNRLSIKGRRAAEVKAEGETLHLSERAYGTFARTFTLPEEVLATEVHAELKDGVLFLSIPKRPESKPQKIKIQG